MADLLECKKCKKSFPASPTDELRNVGTFWKPMYQETCPHCGTVCRTIVFESPPGPALDKIIATTRCKVNPNKGVVEFSKEYGIPPDQRARELGVREWWVQLYVKEKYAQLGFTSIEGPFDTGPDFKGTYKRKAVEVEVEVVWQNYLDHKHDTNSKWGNVSVLIVLGQDKPPAKERKRLPKDIIYLDLDDFANWFKQAATEYAKTKAKEEPINKLLVKVHFIANEFHRRFLGVCPDKERDMATCPECDRCPYFGEGTSYEATPFFEAMAIDFLGERFKDDPTATDFRLTDIEPAAISAYFAARFGH